MDKKFANAPFHLMLRVAIIAAIIIIIGSFYDQSFSRAIADTSSGFGAFVETWGELPAYLMITFGGAIAFTGFINKKGWGYKVAGIIILLLAIGLPAYFWAKSIRITPNDGLIDYGFMVSENLGICLLISLIFHLATAGLTFFFLRKKDANLLIKIGLIMVSTMLLQFAFQELLKPLAGRPRWRFLVDEGGIYEGTTYTFQNWWNWAFFSNPKVDYFKSWPSGHTATASATMELCLLAELLPEGDNRKKWLRPLLFLSGAIYALIVAFARVQYGAHYLSDVGSGCLMTIAFMFLCTFFGQKIFDKLTKKGDQEATSSKTETVQE